MIVTYATYLAVTDDDVTASGDASDALTDAVALLEEKLGRPLESAERTEAMVPDSRGILRPLATPITVADGYTIRDNSLVFALPLAPVDVDFVTSTWPVEVTYTGGYVERSANPDASNRLPAHVERDLCWAAYRLIHRPAGVTTPETRPDLARSGDTQVKFATIANRTGVDGDVEDVWSKATLRLRRRRI